MRSLNLTHKSVYSWECENITISLLLNSKTDDELGGAGVYIQVSMCDINNSSCDETQLLSTNYTIADSIFKNSHGGKQRPYAWSYTYTGGVNIKIKWGARNNTFNIMNSDFCDNHGIHASGLSIICDGNSNDNNFLIQDSNFTGNNQSFNHALGGAGAAIGITSFDYEHFPTKNNITFERCNFTHNDAYFGAGTAVFSAASNNSPSNYLYFKNCTWKCNHGIVSPALDISSDGTGNHQWSFIVNIHLCNCTLLDNSAHDQRELTHDGMYDGGLGVMLVSQLTVHVGGETLFANNQGCALALFSAQIIFEEEAMTAFTNNNCYCMNSSNIRFNFKQPGSYNSTQSTTEHAQYSSYSCFMQRLLALLPRM